jgi:hypothetical protein
MLYDTKNCWVYGLFPSSEILNNWRNRTNTTLRKPDLVPFSGEPWEATALLGSLEKS